MIMLNYHPYVPNFTVFCFSKMVNNENLNVYSIRMLILRGCYTFLRITDLLK